MSLVAVLEHGIDRALRVMCAQVDAPSLATVVVAMVLVQQERGERVLEVGQHPVLDRDDLGAGTHTEADGTSAAKVLLCAKDPAVPLEVERLLRANDRVCLEHGRIAVPQAGTRAHDDGQSFDTVVASVDSGEEVRAAEGKVATRGDDRAHGSA